MSRSRVSRLVGTIGAMNEAGSSDRTEQKKL